VTVDEFTAEIKKLEALKVMPARAGEEEVKDLRRLGIFQLTEKFPIDIFQEAVIRLCEPGGSESAPFFPAVDEIIQTCYEVVEDRTPKTPRRLTSKFKPKKHKCSKRPERSPALELLLTLKVPYEVRHIECVGEIPATCPKCGGTHLMPDAHWFIMELFPDETKKWNPHFKGLLLCSKCENK